MRRSLVVWLLGLAVAAAAVLAATVAALNLRGQDPVDDVLPTAPAAAEQIARGAYLARAGNCIGCHTARGGAPYAGGLGIETPFGTVFSSNLTPDAATGLGAWSASRFWRALHNGRSRDGRLLVPAFPYPNYTRITREDSDAIYAYLRSLAPVAQRNREHALRFPYDSQFALALWRALYFHPATPGAGPSSGSAEWRRGAYLVQGLGHCNACHASRNALGASVDPLDLGGGLIPMQNWYAPSLASSAEAGVAGWDPEHIVALLKNGVTAQASVSGPMAQVVLNSTQYLTDADLRAMAAYLMALPGEPVAAATEVDLKGGARLYEKHCADCHGERGEGAAGIYPRLAGNRAVSLATPVNLARIVLEGGFAPTTAANPRPFGMPPFATVLSNQEIAEILTYLRNSWGNRAAPVGAVEVGRLRGSR
jgi:mono/diheme cytochrome c family protein